MSKQTINLFIALAFVILIFIAGSFWLRSDRNQLKVSYPTPSPADEQLLANTVESAYLAVIQFLNQELESSGAAYQVVVSPDEQVCPNCFNATVTMPDGSIKNYQIVDDQVTIIE